MCDAKAETTTIPPNLTAIRKELFRHLSEDSDINELSRQFAALKTNVERVDFVGRFLQRYGVKAEFRKDGKCNEMALKLREKGNEMFKKKREKEAWEFYTRSVAWAEGDDLGIAFANRSAVLFEVGLIDECLEDIARAFKNRYPDRLKPKLLARQKNCNRLEREVLRETPYEPVPTIPDKNPRIESASTSVEIATSEKLGRHLVATRDVEPGEILAVEKPFALVLVNQRLNHCHECLKLCYNLIPCPSCTQALYCSEGCRKKALEPYHQYECPILASASNLELDKLKQLPLKLAFLAKPHYEDNLVLDETEVYRSDRYKEIHNLVTNVEKRSVADLFERAFSAAVIFDLVKDHTRFFEDSDDNAQRVFKDVLLMHMQTGPSNFHEISELAPNPEGSYDPEEIACGAFSFLSLLNHSCSPNVTRNCHGDTIVLRAIQSIKKGEQCFDNYGYHHAVSPRVERQSQLKSQYHFECSCKACEENWPHFNALWNAEETAEMDETVLNKLSAVDMATAKDVLEESLQQLKVAEKFIPCRNFCQMQEVVKQCYAVYGNKRRLF